MLERIRIVVDKTTIHIRPFHAGDSECASSLIRRCLREVNSRDYTPSQIERVCAEFTPDKVRARFDERLSYVAVYAEEVVGTATLQGDQLGSVFVLPDLHGHGIGKRLVRHVEEVARGRGIEVLRAHSSLSAFNFYLHLRYERLGQKVEPDGEVTMEIQKRL